MEINGFKIEQFNQYNLPEAAKISTCPICSKDRKKSSEKCLMIDWERALATCQHCGNVIQLHTYVKKENIKNYHRPELKETNLSEKAIKWFEGRGISKATLNILKITESKEWMPQVEKEVNAINFNYFRDGELINVKYRDANKNFKLAKGAEKIFYNLDGCRFEEDVVIVEGEIDCASFIEAGIISVLSVPNGFTKGNVNLDYLDNCIEYFENKKRIYIAVDNDEAGLNGQKELIRRLGADRCNLVTFLDCKDANEYLVKYGKESLIKRLFLSEPVPLEGVSGVLDFEDKFKNYLLNGMRNGHKIGKPHFDKIFSTYENQYIVVVGEPSSGKSDWVDEMVIGYNNLYKWKIGFASKENKPNEIHAAKLAAKLSGQWINNEQQINTEWFENCKVFLHENFKFIDLKESYDLKSVLDKAAEMVKSFGIKVLVIDPFNKIKLKESANKGVNDYTSDYLNMIDDFCTKYDVLVILVVHPIKILPKNGTKEEITAYHIKGGGEFYDMTPHILLVDRNYDINCVSVKVLKVKFHHLGENKAKRYFKWNPNNGRFSQFDHEVSESPEFDMPTLFHDNSNLFLNESVHEPEFYDKAPF